MTDQVTDDVATPTTEPAPRRRIPLWAILAAAVIVVAAAAFGVWRAVTPGTLTVHGLEEVGITGMTGTGSGTDGNFNPGDPCTTADGFGDIAAGAEVDVVDAAGKVLGTGVLGAGKAGAGGFSCNFLFTVRDVPDGQSLYGVKVGNASRGIVHFTRAQLVAGPALTVG